MGTTILAVHAGRHSFARFAQRLLEKKANPDTSRIIQTLLHHRTEGAQRDYTDVDFNYIRKVAQTMMPKPKKRGRPKIK
jgi:integrase|tara:strand:- start:255 stop:491 length:237 start_codon:yes stop_codon:yes gene_type:complete